MTWLIPNQSIFRQSYAIIATSNLLFLLYHKILYAINVSARFNGIFSQIFYTTYDNLTKILPAH